MPGAAARTAGGVGGGPAASDGPHDPHVVSLELPVGGQDRQILELRLSHQEAVEGITMVIRQSEAKESGWIDAGEAEDTLAPPSPREERTAAERERKEREAAVARDAYLNALEKSKEKAWLRVEALIATKQPSRDDEAIRELTDLRDLARRRGREEPALERIRHLAAKHSAKHSLLKRMIAIGFISG